MIRVSVYWRNGSKENRDHEWSDEHWYWAWNTWKCWVKEETMSHGVLWLTAEEDNSADHVILDRYSKEPLPWSPRP